MKPTKLDRLHRFILEFKIAHDGNSPSMRDIVDAELATSTSVARDMLRRLEKAGRIQLGGANTARMIVVPGGEWVPPEGV